MNLLCVSYVARYNKVPYLYRVLVFVWYARSATGSLGIQ